MTKHRIAGVLATLGGLSLLVALGWWWVVFRALIDSASMTVSGALPCLARTSDLCTLAQALCAQQHFLGIRRYDVLLFWVGAVLAVGATLSTLRRPSGARAAP